MNIIFEHVSKRYRTNFSRKMVDAVTDLSLTIESGEIFGIIGPNGAGKSTLLKMLMGFIRPTTGKIKLLGETPDNPKIKHHIGYLPENPYYYDHLSAVELMRFSARTSGMRHSEIEPRIDNLLNKLSLEHAKNRKLRGYSKGMTQRAGICYALVHDPKLVILDEPMSGLDPIGRKDIVDLVIELKAEGKTILFCSHILNDVERLCDRMAIMNKGRLMKVMTQEELKNSAPEFSISCGALTDSQSDELRTLGATVGTASGTHRILCPKTSMRAILKILNDQNVDLLDFHPSEDALETLFFKTIKSELPQ